jgi:hypothetical protein
MTIFRRLLLSLALLAVALVALAVARKWQWPAGAPAPVGPQDEEAWRARQLQVARRRIDAKREVVRRLLAGRLTLLETAALFRDLNEEPDDCPCRDNPQWPGASREEHLCRQVVNWARQMANEEGSRATGEAADRLEAELAALLARGRAIRLPGDDPGR